MEIDSIFFIGSGNGYSDGDGRGLGDRNDLGEINMNICILHHGWVLVGKLEQTDDDYFLSNASVIRQWGTIKRLEEIAANGPLPSTLLEGVPSTKFNKSQLIFTIPCVESRWK